MLTSWYGSYFHGRTTANGETYNMYGNTAAHKTLPFNTKLKSAINNAQPSINDRGPFIVRINDRLTPGKDIGCPGVANVQITSVLRN